MNKSSLCRLSLFIAASMTSFSLCAMQGQQESAPKKENWGVMVRYNGGICFVDYDPSQPVQVLVDAAAKKLNVSSKKFCVATQDREITGRKDFRWGAFTPVELVKKNK